MTAIATEYGIDILGPPGISAVAMLDVNTR
jgi:hypothetical protein